MSCFTKSFVYERKMCTYFLSRYTHVSHSRSKQRNKWSESLSTYTQIFSPKKPGFPPYKILPKIFWLLFTFILCNFSVNADPTIFSKKQFNWFFTHKNFKKWALKVSHNHPRPFFLTSQPRPQPTVQNWFFILWNLVTRHLFSYLWLHLYLVLTGHCTENMKEGVMSSIAIAFRHLYLFSLGPKCDWRNSKHLCHS